MRFRVIDLETTGMMPPAEIIEIGWADVALSPTAAIVGTPSAKLFRPLGPIPPETAAVHHITPEDIPADAPTATTAELRSAILQAPKPDVLVAHHCDFERKFITANVTEELP